jgi:hypothetical protein
MHGKCCVDCSKADGRRPAELELPCTSDAICYEGHTDFGLFGRQETIVLEAWIFFFSLWTHKQWYAIFVFSNVCSHHHHQVLYVIILSAALDLVPPSTPKGIIAFCNITPALIAKLGWPYFLKGRIRYARRIVGCCTLSFIGMLVT